MLLIKRVFYKDANNNHYHLTSQSFIINCKLSPCDISATPKLTIKCNKTLK